MNNLLKKVVVIILLVATMVQAQSSCDGDFNSDGARDFNDFLGFAENYGENVDDTNRQYDIDLNNFVGFGDFLVFAENYGVACQIPRLAKVSVPSNITGDFDNSGCVDDWDLRLAEDDLSFFSGRVNFRITGNESDFNYNIPRFPSFKSPASPSGPDYFAERGNLVGKYDMNEDFLIFSNLSGEISLALGDLTIFNQYLGEGECGDEDTSSVETDTDAPASIVVLGDNNFECEILAEEEDRDYCWDRQAASNFNIVECENIEDEQLREFCRYRVGVFSGTYSKTLLAYNARIERPSNMNLNRLLSDRETKELSLAEYEAIGERNRKVIVSGEGRFNGFLFVIEAPENQSFGNLGAFGPNVYMYDRSEFGAFFEERRMNIDEDVYVRVREGGEEYISLGDHRARTSDVFAKNDIPVIDGKISFIVNSYYNIEVIDKPFETITFTENEGDSSLIWKIWGRSELKPNGEFERI